MTMRVAILGGGMAGLAAAYELEQQRRAGKPLEWHLFEASDRLGGTVQTTRRTTADGEYILEGGPDAWVTEKPWAQELAEELGLGNQVMACKEAGKKTYIWLGDELVPMPDGMRLMVPADLATLERSPLFTTGAKQAYARELERAEDLKASVPAEDESVASFVQRHFGDEVLEKIGAPLLSGVFGGDTAKLSVRAVLPAFVKMEAEQGSLIAALQTRSREHEGKEPRPTFTTLRRGMETLTEAIVSALPQGQLHTRCAARRLARSPEARWAVFVEDTGGARAEPELFDEVLLAVPVDAARALLQEVDAGAADLIPQHASSAVLATFCWSPAQARQIALPPGFGFLVPQTAPSPDPGRPQLLAGTFTAQKFPSRAPEGACVVRVFFGGDAALRMQGRSDQEIAAESMAELRRILQGLPEPEASLTTVARWPRSLPQYEVGHLERMAQLRDRVHALGHLRLLGNGYRGVGVPDLIRDARSAAREVARV